MLVSASDAPTLFDLRCDVREGMVEWLQRSHPGALPRRRLELDSPGEGSPRRRNVHAPQAKSSLFSGSRDAERRSELFDGPDDDDRVDRDREFARVRYDGG